MRQGDDDQVALAAAPPSLPVLPCPLPADAALPPHAHALPGASVAQGGPRPPARLERFAVKASASEHRSGWLGSARAGSRTAVGAAGEKFSGLGWAVWERVRVREDEVASGGAGERRRGAAGARE